ncbi:PTS sugar transporter subunit IIA [Neobacillus rhizosphaerae]|nr:PTS glucose transporter subunit IIA [Neobacillus rhizosphaerae]
MFSRFKKSPTNSEELFAPVNGDVVEITEVPDVVFSQKMMGDGFGIIPKDGRVLSPVEGKIVQIFPTKHALGIETKSGLELLIHIGLETVTLKGEGYDVIVSEGQSVKVGDPLVNVDLQLLEEHSLEIITPVVITNFADKVKRLHVTTEGTVSAGQAIAIVELN